VFAFAVRTSGGIVLVDTGIGPAHELIDRLYAPARYSVAAHGIAIPDVVAIVNTHLHFDHCGGNALFARVPAYVQSDEYTAALEPGYTVPAWVAFEGARFQMLGGDAEISPGVRVIATSGHTPGHQSVLVDCDDGAVVIAGQAVETAAEFRDAIERPSEHADCAANVQKLLDLAPRRVYFSHDDAYWEPAVAL
jgi:glyoxylase-like metal-dependent hydrolase (beta-lactamase superfamily II)